MGYALAAVLAACLLVAGGFAIVWQGRAMILSRFERVKQELKEKRDAGQLPPELQGADLDGLNPSQVGLRLSAAEQTWLDLANLLSSLWFVLVPLAFVIGLGAAAVGRVFDRSP